MTVEAVPLEALLDAREKLIAGIQERAREEPARRFLTSFHDLAPDWEAIGFDPKIGELPAVRWKLLNLERLRSANAAKYADQLRLLEQRSRQRHRQPTDGPPAGGSLKRASLRRRGNPADSLRAAMTAGVRHVAGG